MPRPKLKVSIFSLAKEFGVSAPTISKALSNSNEVSDALRERVRARAEELGFRPTRPRRKNFNLCVVLDMEFHNRFRFSGFQEAVVEGVYGFCDEKGVEFSLYAQTTEKLNAVNLTRELHLRNADGAVVIGASGDRSYFGNLRKSRLPFCCIFDGPDDRVVSVDNHAAGRLAFDHLHALGHHRIAIARQAADRTAARDRFLGFVRRAGEAGLEDGAVTELLPESPYSAFDWGRGLLVDWLEGGRPWSGIFCLAENVALGILSEAAMRGVRIPADLSVIGCDDLLLAQRSAPPMSVVDIPNRAAGCEAAQRVWRELNDPGDRDRDGTLLPVERVIARATTGPRGGINR